MASGADAFEPPANDRSLAETLAALANQPVGDSWVERKRAQTLGFAERVTTRGAFAVPGELAWQVTVACGRSGAGRSRR